MNWLQQKYSTFVWNVKDAAKHVFYKISARHFDNITIQFVSPTSQQFTVWRIYMIVHKMHH